MRNRPLFVLVVAVILAVAVEGQGWSPPSPWSPPTPPSPRLRPSLSPSHFGSVGGGGWGLPDPQWGGGRSFGRGGGSSTATTRSWGRRSPTRYSRRSIYRSWSSWSTDRPLSTASWRRYSGRSIHGSALGKTAGSSWARYQEEKASSKFYLCTHCRRWKYTDWNRWRKKEGMLCRTSADCNWLNQDLRCSSYKRSFTPNHDWFNGDFASIHGQCECPMGMVWNDWELTCYVPAPMSEGWVIVLIFVLILLVVVAGGAKHAHKKRSASLETPLSLNQISNSSNSGQ